MTPLFNRPNLSLLDTGDTRQGGTAGPPAGVKTGESTLVEEEEAPRLTRQKRVKAAEDESDDDDVRPAKTAKKEEEPADAPKPAAVPRVCSIPSSHLCGGLITLYAQHCC